MSNSGSSLPSRERELKPEGGRGAALEALSLPSRERELKLDALDLVAGVFFVAPLAGARIETRRATACGQGAGVAPLAGARIET